MWNELAWLVFASSLFHFCMLFFFIFLFVGLMSGKKSEFADTFIILVFLSNHVYLACRCWCIQFLILISFAKSALIQISLFISQLLKRVSFKFALFCSFIFRWAYNHFYDISDLFHYRVQTYTHTCSCQYTASRW